VHVYFPTKIRPRHIQIAVVLIILLVFPFRSFLNTAFIQLSKQCRLSSVEIDHQNKELRNKIAVLSLRVKDLQYLEDENKRLLQALDFKQKNGARLLGVEVISFDPSSWRKIVTVTGGVKDGVHEGMFAIDEEGLLIGKIIDVKDNSSRLMLIDDPDFNLSVFIGDSGFGLLQGSLEGITVSYVEQGEQIKIKDQIWAKIPSLNFPVTVGEVKNVKMDDNSLFWDIEVKLYSKHPLLHKIFVIK
jgi:rod shape-determining protein MreC